MNKTDFSILMFLSLLFAGLVGLNLWLMSSNGRLNMQLAQEQQSINQARQLEPVLDNLAKRIAKGSDSDPRLREVLKKNQLQVTLDTGNGEQKKYP